LVAGSQHLFHVTVCRKNKNDRKVNSRPKVFCAFADDVAEAWCNHLCEFDIVSLALFGVSKPRCLG
jgi:hypothetical protein